MSTAPRHKRTFRHTFLAGLFVILPIAVTVWILRFVFGQLDRATTPVVLRIIRATGGKAWVEASWVDYVAPVVSITLMVAIIYGLGLVGGNVVGQAALRAIERLITRIPVARSIYLATRQFLDTFSNGSRKAFQRVVLVEYPRRGLWTMGLLTNDSDRDSEVQTKTEAELVSVFVPTTPNPTSGWLLFVPSHEVVELEMSVDDAFKMIISGGVLVPEYTPPTSPPA